MSDIVDHYKVNYLEKNLPGKFCSFPWDSISVTENGGVYSCHCVDWNGLQIGNLLETNIEEIYAESSNLKKIRGSVLDGKFGWCKVGQCDHINRLPDKNPSNSFKVDNSEFYLPTLINLGIEYNCNLKCGSCRNSLHFKSEINPKVSTILTSLSKPYKNYNKPTHVFCDGLGDIFTSKSYENFLYGDEFPECWKVTFQTNGNLLSKRKSQLLSIKNNISSVLVSLDASTPETYKIVRGGDWSILMKGLDVLAEIEIPFHFQYVLQRENYKDLLGYKEIANRYNVHFGLQKIDRRHHMSFAYWNHNKIEDNPEVDYDILKNYLDILNEDINCTFDGGLQELYKKL